MLLNTTLPKGLTLKLPAVGVSTDVTAPTMLVISLAVDPATFTQTPLELRDTKSPSANPLYEVLLGLKLKKSVK